MRINALMMILLAMGCGIVATIGVSQVEDRPGQQAALTGGEKLFVADVSIKAGEPFTPQNVRLERWPRDRVPDTAIKRLEELHLQFAQQDFSPGEALRRSPRLQSTNTGTGATKAISTSEQSLIPPVPDHSAARDALSNEAQPRTGIKPPERTTSNTPQPFVVHISMSVHPTHDSSPDMPLRKQSPPDPDSTCFHASSLSGSFLVPDPNSDSHKKSDEGGKSSMNAGFPKLFVPPGELDRTSDD